MNPNARGLSSFPSILDQLGGVAREIDSFFEPARLAPRTAFPLDVESLEDGYRVTVALPGISKDQVDVTLEKRQLTISIDAKSETQKEDQRYLVKEVRQISGSRAITFPDQVKEEGIEATLSDGVLSIFVRKAAEARPKKITIG